MQKEILAISIVSLLKLAPAMAAFLALVLGFYQFYIKRSHDHMLQGKAKVLAYGIFAILFTLRLMVPLLGVALVYNWVAPITGGIHVTLH